MSDEEFQNLDHNRFPEDGEPPKAESSSALYTALGCFLISIVAIFFFVSAVCFRR